MQGAGAQGRRIDSSEDGVEFFEFGEAHTESLHDGAGMRSAWVRRASGFGEFDDQWRSSAALRVRVMRPPDSSRLSNGESVGESSCSACPISSPTWVRGPQCEHHEVLRVCQAHRLEKGAVDRQHCAVGNREGEAHLPIEGQGSTSPQSTSCSGRVVVME